MKTPKIRLIAALIFPIVVLMANTWMNYQQREAGQEVVFPITGYDPRDLLSGHYLAFRVSYDIPQGNGCPASDIAAALCLKPEKRVYAEDELPTQCELYLRGTCNSQSEFDANLERFYVPEKQAPALEQKVRDGHAKLVISLDQRGHAMIRDLYIHDKPWQESLDL